MSGLWAVVPAAGSGRRMASDLPKQYLEVAGRTLLEHSLDALLACSEIRGLAVALGSDDERADQIASFTDPRVFRTVGGAERADSVLAGLDCLSDTAEENDWVLVHDAARPCLPLADLQRLISRVIETDVGGLLAERCIDTIKRVDADGRVISTLDRNELWRAQTPQMFRIGELRGALEQCLAAGQVTDEASAMERCGYSVQIVEGSSCNLKVTVPSDIPLVEFYLSAQSRQRS